MSREQKLVTYFHVFSFILNALLYCSLTCYILYDMLKWSNMNVQLSVLNGFQKKIKHRQRVQSLAFFLFRKGNTLFYQDEANQ